MSPKLRAYLVEDSPLIRDNLIATLQELLPVEVVGCAADERDAVDWLAAGRERCDLMIVDLFLRRGSGLGVLAAAGRLQPQPRCVVLSNYATPEMRERCAALGADRVFDKSRDIDALLAYCRGLAAAPAGARP